MPGVVLTYDVTMTTSGGTVSLNMTDANGFQSMHFGGILKHLFIKAATVGTIFDVKMTSPADNIVYIRKNINTVLRELISLPIRGTYTLTIENADKDEAFAVEAGFKEEKG